MCREGEGGVDFCEAQGTGEEHHHWLQGNLLHRDPLVLPLHPGQHTFQHNCGKIDLCGCVKNQPNLLRVFGVSSGSWKLRRFWFLSTRLLQAMDGGGAGGDVAVVALVFVAFEVVVKVIVAVMVVEVVVVVVIVVVVVVEVVEVVVVVVVVAVVIMVVVVVVDVGVELEVAGGGGSRQVWQEYSIL